jgi:F-type H+-transporting ATPase subunit gamma
MSGAALSLRRKITSAGDLLSVVRSMKALAASSIGQYEGAMRALDDYYRTVALGLSVCLRQLEPAAAPAEPAPRKPRTTGAILFGSDQGLVGRFNESLLESATQTLAALPATTIWVVGERMGGLVEDSSLGRASQLSVPTSVRAITPLVGRIIVAIETALERGEVGEILLFHNRPLAGAAYEPVHRRLLPLDRTWSDALVALPWPTKLPPEVIEGAVPALPDLIRAYLFVLLFQACAESLASENASRLAAMQRAEKNIKDILEALNSRFHRERQEAIDEELFDVISGYGALAAK